MNKFESILILNPKLDVKDVRSFLFKMCETISKIPGIDILHVENLGAKTLAYQVKGHTTGWFGQIIFHCEPSKRGAIEEIERIFRIHDEVIKLMTIPRDNSGPSIDIPQPEHKLNRTEIRDRLFLDLNNTPIGMTVHKTEQPGTGKLLDAQEIILKGGK